MFAYAVAAVMVFMFGFREKEVNLGDGSEITNINIDGGGVVGYGYTRNGYVIVQINEDGIYSFSAVDSSGHERVFLSLDKVNVRVLLRSDGSFFGDSDSLFIHRLDKPTRETAE
jgi:hypothetical protein